MLLWGLGNEMEGDGRNADYWKQINRLAKMVHEEDPAHPTFTAVAGLSAEKAKGLNEHAPDLDLVGINTYGALFGLQEAVRPDGLEASMGGHGVWAAGLLGITADAVACAAGTTSSTAEGGDDPARLRECDRARRQVPGRLCRFFGAKKQEATATWFSTVLHHPRREHGGGRCAAERVDRQRPGESRARNSEA